MRRDWDLQRAVEQLGFELVSWEDFWEGRKHSLQYREADGVSNGSKMAVKDDAPYRLAVALHELGHLVLGHSQQDSRDRAFQVARREIEAEKVAAAVAERLGLSGADYSAEASEDYLKGWYVEYQSLGSLADEINEAGIEEAVEKTYRAGLAE